MPTRLPTIFFIFSLIIFATLTHPLTRIKSASPSLVISEIQSSGDTTGTPTHDEFVELYNPTASPVTLTDWKLSRKTQGGTESDLLTLSGTVAPHGFFLIAHEHYNGTPAANLTYPDTNGSIADNNTLLLYQNSTLIDKVGFGTATDKETTAIANPASNKSVERKANSLSDAASLRPPGADATAGNGLDTDNNSTNFATGNISDPQNTSSPIEPPLAPTETPTPTLTETPTPTPTPTATPTETPTPTPTHTPTPTSTPTPTHTPTPTLVPANLRSLNNSLFTCTVIWDEFDLFGRIWKFPNYTCTLLP